MEYWKRGRILNCYDKRYFFYKVFLDCDDFNKYLVIYLFFMLKIFDYLIISVTLEPKFYKAIIKIYSFFS